MARDGCRPVRKKADGKLRWRYRPAAGNVAVEPAEGFPRDRERGSEREKGFRVHHGPEGGVAAAAGGRACGRAVEGHAAVQDCAEMREIMVGHGRSSFVAKGRLVGGGMNPLAHGSMLGEVPGCAQQEARAFRLVPADAAGECGQSGKHEHVAAHVLSRLACAYSWRSPEEDAAAVFATLRSLGIEGDLAYKTCLATVRRRDDALYDAPISPGPRLSPGRFPSRPFRCSAPRPWKGRARACPRRVRGR